MARKLLHAAQKHPRRIRKPFHSGSTTGASIVGDDRKTLWAKWLRLQSPKNVEAGMSVKRDFLAKVALLKLQSSGTNGASGSAKRKAQSAKRKAQSAKR